MSLTAVVDLAQVREGLHVLEDLQIRLANTTADLERKFLELKPYGQV